MRHQAKEVERDRKRKDETPGKGRGERQEKEKIRHQARGGEKDRKKNKQDGMKKGSAENVKKDEEMFEVWKRSMERRLGFLLLLELSLPSP